MIRENEYANIRYAMGFMVNGTAIPDPSAFTGAVSVFDTLDKPDALGYQHRCVIATKSTLKLKYQNIPWTMIRSICGLMASTRFRFTYPDPAVGTVTIDAHAVDLGWEAVSAVPNCEHIGNLVFTVIEY